MTSRSTLHSLRQESTWIRKQPVSQLLYFHVYSLVTSLLNCEWCLLVNNLLMDSTSTVSVASTVATAAVSAEPISVKDIPFVFDPTQQSYSLAEVAQHSGTENPWIVVNNRVYDCTEFLRLHPGGADSILINAGTDSSEEFDAIHSIKAWKMLDKYYIGQLKPVGGSLTSLCI